ncbi:hypothetical protein B0T24DRAFT_681997 [Lasiosphaeria ovina]|uniref:Uncharacterized protein n=1 Tax=Lasiosphaeria ovina TaxID=92902 RepID=A0AAE0N0Y1_9PEZI|nr:hypothetical protein B0T24DRAFT_681997 [Lasiosphaeria ovina]
MHLPQVLFVSVSFAVAVLGGPTLQQPGRAVSAEPAIHNSILQTRANVHNNKAEGRTWCPGNWLRSIADIEAAMSDLSIYCDKGHKIGGKQTLKDVTNTAQVHICNLLDTPILCSSDMINSARAAVIQACGKAPSGNYLAGYYYDDANTYTIGFNNYGEKVDC